MILCIGCNDASDYDEVKRIDTYSIQFGGPDGYLYTEEFNVIIIDSCEYLMGSHDRSRMITHKGNCKHCNKK